MRRNLDQKKRDAPSVTKGKGQAARMRKVGFRSKLNIRLRQERLEQLATLPTFRRRNEIVDPSRSGRSSRAVAMLTWAVPTPGIVLSTSNSSRMLSGEMR